MNLFEIKSEYLAVLEMLDDPETDPQTVADTLESIKMDFSDKAENYARMGAKIDADISAMYKEYSRLQKRMAAFRAFKERLFGNLCQSMDETGNTKIKTPFHTIWTQDNPAGVKWVEGKQIPDKYLKPQEPKPDTAAVLKALKAGEKFDFAELSRTRGVRVR